MTLDEALTAGIAEIDAHAAETFRQLTEMANAAPLGDVERAAILQILSGLVLLHRTKVIEEFRANLLAAADRPLVH